MTPAITRIAAAATALPLATTLLYGAVWAMDQRYAQNQDIERAMRQMRLKQIDDRLFELRIKRELGQLSEVERAVLRRLEDERNDVSDDARP